MLFYLQSPVLFKALKLNLDFIRSFSRNWKNFQPIYELKKLIHIGKKIFSILGKLLCYHFIFFENIAFIPASSELWYRCFQCWPPFLLTCHLFFLVCIFSLPMLVWPGKTDHFNMCYIPIMDIPSLLFNKWTNGSTEYIRRERKWKWSLSVLSDSLQPPGL